MEILFMIEYPTLTYCSCVFGGEVVEGLLPTRSVDEIN